MAALALAVMAAVLLLAGCGGSTTQGAVPPGATRAAYSLDGLQQRLLAIAGLDPDSRAPALINSYDPWLAEALTERYAAEVPTVTVDDVLGQGVLDVYATIQQAESVAPTGAYGRIERWVATKPERLSERRFILDGSTKDTPFEGMTLYSFDIATVYRMTASVPGYTDADGRVAVGLFGIQVANHLDKWFLVCVTPHSIRGPVRPADLEIAAELARDAGK